MAKGEGITIFLVGHVNKEGAIAGPKVLEIWSIVSCLSRRPVSKLPHIKSHKKPLWLDE
jgi:predicted ATP-dependent serine protease